MARASAPDGDDLSLAGCYTVGVLDRITINPEVCRGKPTVRGMRITVDFVLKLLGDGLSTAEIVELYPELEEADILQSVRYGAWLASERSAPLA